MNPVRGPRIELATVLGLETHARRPRRRLDIVGAGAAGRVDTARMGLPN